MAVHLFVTLILEALIDAMFSLEEFDAFYAEDSEKKSRGQTIFFEIGPKVHMKEFRIEEGNTSFSKELIFLTDLISIPKYFKLSNKRSSWAIKGYLR